jgi:hypothetical protein
MFRLDRPEDCPICTESLAGERQPLSCGHWVHRKCILQWKDECPICKAKVRLTKRERLRLLAKESKDSRHDSGDGSDGSDGFDLDDQAILSLMRRDFEESALFESMDDIDDINYLDAEQQIIVMFIIGNALRNISRGG